MGLKCFAAATAAQNGVGTDLLAAPCGTSAATAVTSAHVNDSTCNNGIQLIVLRVKRAFKVCSHSVAVATVFLP